ncbi:MAG: hypothetical protein QOD06_731 [Candidatus Binatota bacterium]|nr:hypothetical protein [Candidatus Binatota bacterium]
MTRPVALALIATVAASSGCGMADSWSKRRQARALESRIESQREALQEMTPTELERAEGESREKAIAQYEKILKEYSDVGREEKDEALYLLGRLLFDRESREFERAQDGYERERQRDAAAGRTPPPEPKPRYPSAKAVYERLLKEFPDSAFREDALYDLGYIHLEEGNAAEGTRYLTQLISTFPRSRYAPEAHFRLAESAFESYRLEDAEKHYREVLNRNQQTFTAKALFKLGWVYYNLNRYDDAKRVLGTLLERQARQVEHEGGEFAPAPILFFPGPRRAALEKVQDTKNDDLYKETLEIIARVYADSGGADALVAFSRRQTKGGAARPYAAPLLHRLALVQRERSEFQAASQTYDRLLAAYPTYRDAPKLELEWVKVLEELHQPEQAAAVREKLLTKYDAGSPWARANPEQEYREAALASARKALSWSIRYYHARGLERQKQEGGVPAELRTATSLYEKYLKRFPDAKSAGEKRFRYAQVLYAAGEYARAADAFRQAAAQAQQPARREEAAFARILSLDKVADAARGGNEKRPLPLPLADSMIGAYEEYVGLNPQSNKNAAILFKEGQLLLETQRYPAAIGTFERLAKAYPGDPLASEANDLVAQAHFRAGDMAAAQQWSERALAQGRAAGGERQREIENLFATTLFQQAEKADREKRHGEAATDYLRIVDRLPGSDVAPRALYNSAVAAAAAGNRDQAAGLLDRLLHEYPSSDVGPDAAVRLAEILQTKPGAGAEIVPVYEQVADHLVSDPKGEELLFLAAKISAKQTQPSETVRLFEKFLTRYPSTDLGPRGSRNVEALYHLGVATADAGDGESARYALEQFLSRARPGVFGEGPQAYAFAVAKANLMLGEVAEREFEAAEIVPPVTETAKQKERLLNQVIERYTPAVASGLSPIATQASYAIGKAYETHASALLAAPKPAGLTPEEETEYDRLLAESVRPYFQKAVDAYRATVRAAEERKIDDEWVRKSRERLQVITPRASAGSASPRSARGAECDGRNHA